jgi:hypothetical protein
VDLTIVVPVVPWRGDWLWGLPLIATTVVIHSFGLRQFEQRLSRALKGEGKNQFPHWALRTILPGTAIYATCLHGLEAGIWASAYAWLGALPDRKSAMLYSLNAMTTYGHANLSLELHWQLMGSLEALNGLILFGLTTAFLFTVLQRVWPRLDRAA